MKTKTLQLFPLLIAGLMLLSSPSSVAGINIAGELIVDLRSIDLNPDLTVWTNRGAGAGLVGDFQTKGGGKLNVASVGGISKALRVDGKVEQSVVSSRNAPTSLQGNGTRSVEAWVYTVTIPRGSTPVGWGTAGLNLADSFLLSSFRNTDDVSNGMFSSWANDAGWGDSENPKGEWGYYAWTWDGKSVRGYRNGKLIRQKDLKPLLTANAKICVGSARNGTTGAIDGYVADVRVHTGVLTSGQIEHNYVQGIEAIH